MLEVLRWVSQRYLAPLATVIERSHPPRVAGAERGLAQAEGIGSSRPARDGGGGVRDDPGHVVPAAPG